MITSFHMKSFPRSKNALTKLNGNALKVDLNPAANKLMHIQNERYIFRSLPTHDKSNDRNN